MLISTLGRLLERKGTALISPLKTIFQIPCYSNFKFYVTQNQRTALQSYEVFYSQYVLLKHLQRLLEVYISNENFNYHWCTATIYQDLNRISRDSYA